MASFDFNFEYFFDRDGVQKAVHNGSKKALVRIGAFTRSVAQRLIRPSKKTAQPGNPPKGHLGLLRKLIFFAYQEDRESVIIAPQALSGRHHDIASDMLEFGGNTVTDRGKPAFYRAFPFMKPAYEVVEPKFPDYFCDGIKEELG